MVDLRINPNSWQDSSRGDSQPLTGNCTEDQIRHGDDQLTLIGLIRDAHLSGDEYRVLPSPDFDQHRVDQSLRGHRGPAERV